jgi:O-antigen/teichoic acid export membrane protein
MTSIKQLAVRGAIWTILGYGSSQILRLGSNIILTRLLAPDLFGLMALVYAFLTALNLFSDIGVGPNIVQNKRGNDPDFLNTAWTMQVLRGSAIWLCCLIIAFPVGYLYNKPELYYLIPIVGFGSVISSFNSTALYTLDREINLRKTTIYALAEQVISVVILLIWARISPTIWALVGGSLVSTIISTVWSHFLIPNYRNRFTWDWTAVQEIFSFGKWIFVSTAITFFSEQSDRLILGKLVPLALLGVYSIAYTLADVPRSITVTLSGKVIFPALAKFSDLPRSEMREKLVRNRQPILWLFIVGETLMVSFGDRLIALLYDQRYTDAQWMLPILCLGIWPRVLCNTNEPALFAIGKVQYPAFAQLIRFIFTAIAMIVGFQFFGVLGAVIGVALNDLCFYVVINYGLWKEGLSGLMQDLQATILLAIALTVVLTLRYQLGFGLPIDSMR